MWKPISHHLYDKYDKTGPKKVRINDISKFQNFDYARYDTNLAFQHTNRPPGNLQESNKYFSVKHHLYGYKLEASVISNGLETSFKTHNPGSISGVDILSKYVLPQALFLEISILIHTLL